MTPGKVLRASANRYKILQSHGLAFKLARTNRRKTVSIQIRQGEVFILAPRGVPLAEIEAIIDKKIGWVRTKLHEQHKVVLPPVRTYQTGELFTYLGKDYPLQICQGVQQKVELSDGRINLQLASAAANVQKVLTAWYKQQADAYLAQCTRDYARMMGVQPTSIVVKTYKARWGSCYSDGRISFNWKIIIAPPNVVDYVVVHELSHLVHPNHSADFWRLVGLHYPEYQAAKIWLKQYGQMLEV